MTDSPAPKRRFLVVCQNRSCVRSGSEAVLAAFKEAVKDHPTLFVTGTGCLGQCGSGPTVQVNPDDIWYCRVRPEDVPQIVDEHLLGDRPVRRLLHPRFHAHYDPANFPPQTS